MRAKLVLHPHPFDTRERRVLELGTGDRVGALLPGGVHAGWAVTVNGRAVPVEVLHELELAPGDLATARAVPGEPATIAFVVALIVKAALAYFGYTGTAALVISAVAGAAAGYAAQQAQSPDVSKQASAPNSQPFYSVTGARNQLRPFGVVPQHYGRLRVVPDLLAPVITSVSDDGVQTVRGLFAIGIGRYSGVTDAGDAMKLGSQAISSLGLKDFAEYTGLEDADPPSVRLARFAQNVFEQPLGLELHHVAVTGSVEQIQTTAEDALAFDVQLVFPQGLWRISNSNHQQNASIIVRVRYRLVGATDWIVFASEILTGFITEKFPKLYHVDPDGAGQYEVSVQILPNMNRGLYTTDRGGTGGSVALTGDAVWLALRSYLLGDAINDAATDDVSMFGIALDASELVSGALDQVSIDCERMLPTWTEADGWSDVALGARNPAAYTATSNPAWAFANELRTSGVPDEEIDAEQIAAWADFCDEKGWSCNWQENDEITLDDAQRSIASAGQAFPAPRGALFSVVYDVDRDPVAAFGPRNGREFVSTQLPIERVDAIRARFVNSTQVDGRLDERVVYFNGYGPDTAVFYKTADVLNGLTDPVLVERYIRLERLKAENRTTVHQWKSDLSAVVVEVGDVVLLANAGELRGAAQSEVTGYSTRDAGAHLDELFVDPAIRIEAGRTYYARVRTRARGASGGFRLLTVPIDNPLTAGVQMLSALPVEGNVAPPTYVDDTDATVPDDLVGQPLFAGEASDGLVMVTDVKFDSPGVCSLSAVDFAPQIFTAPLIETPHDPRTDPQLLANLAPAQPALGGDPYRRLTGRAANGYSLYEFVVPLADPPAFPPIARYRVQYRYHISGSLTNVSMWLDTDDEAPSRELVIGPLLLVNPIDVRVWAISTAGAPSPSLVVTSPEF